MKMRRGVASNLASIAIVLMITFFIASAVLPSAIQTVIDVNTTTWDTSAETLWDLLPTMGVIGVFLTIVGFALGKRGGWI